MILRNIHLRQFRSYQDAQFQFDPALTLISGKNGIGKTNLLEAIYVLTQGASFRVGDADLIQDDEQWWRIDGSIDGDDRQVRYQLEHKPAKQLIVHDTAKRFSYKDRLPVVLFEPTDLQLIHGSPSRRRVSLDTMLSSLSQPYKTALSRYERALQQRNNILKKQPFNLEDVLFSWDILLSEYGVAIVEARRELIATFNDELSGYYSSIAGSDQRLLLEYRSELPVGITGSQYIAQLHKKLPLDRLRGTTSVGPHRDDVEFYLRDVNAKQSASRGEVRSMLLALKIAYTQALETTYEQKPIVLLDDVLSELDEDRQKQLLTLLNTHQTIITDTKEVSIANQVIRLT